MNLEKLLKVAGAIIAIQADGIDFTKTDMVIKTDYGDITYYKNNTATLSPKNDSKIYVLYDLTK